MPETKNYVFTNNWFQISAGQIWNQIIAQRDIKTVLEIGSYEGAATCYLINHLSKKNDIEVHCIDTWEGGVEHKNTQYDMSNVELNFHKNIQLAKETAQHNVSVHIHKGYSDHHLVRLLAEGKNNYFDFIYVDGSHQAPDVLSDAVLAFKLLKTGGMMIFDDYIWNDPTSPVVDPIRNPKIAIDAFTNIYCRKISILNTRFVQLFLIKRED